MRHSWEYVEAHGGRPYPVGLVRRMHDIPPTIPRGNIGKHRPECSDATIIIGLTWEDVARLRRVPLVTKPRRRFLPRHSQSALRVA
jgi:hypothetical protein